MGEAFDRVDRLPPDVRVILRPYVTQISGAKTAVSTAAVTLDLVRTLLDGREVVVSGQVQLDGEFYDLHAPVGVPIVDRGRLRQVRWEPRLLRHCQPHMVQPRRGHAARPAGETYSGPTRPAAEMVGSVVAELQGEPAADHRAESKRYESDESVKD